MVTFAIAHVNVDAPPIVLFMLIQVTYQVTKHLFQWEFINV